MGGLVYMFLFSASVTIVFPTEFLLSILENQSGKVRGSSRAHCSLQLIVIADIQDLSLRVTEACDLHYLLLSLSVGFCPDTLLF